jgi:spore coat polysaccharide biosynthesis protein SpsF
MLIIIQARMGSTRLPGKVKLRLAGGKDVLGLCVERASLCSTARVCVAVPLKDKGKFRRENTHAVGSDENDVLGRYASVAGQMASANAPIVRITSDCPLVDVSCLEQMENIFYSGNYDYVSNCHPIRYVPSGFDIEMFSYNALMEANAKATRAEDKEHVTSYMHKNMKVASFPLPIGRLEYACQKFSIDTMADYQKIGFLADKLYRENKSIWPTFSMKDVLDMSDKYALELAVIEEKYANKT